MKYFTDILPEKKKYIFTQYNNIFLHLKEMKSLLLKRKISKMKEEIGFLYIDLHEANKVIDEKIFVLINEFKTVFFDKLGEPNLFGMYPKEGLLAVDTALNLLIQKLELKLSELENSFSDKLFV